MRVDDRIGSAMRSHTRRCATHKGFTLVELLVAISVMAMVAVLGWRGLDSIIRSRAAITEDIEQTRGMQLTFAQLESDCAHVAPASLVANRPTLLVADGRLLLVRTVFADDQPTRVQTVSYRLMNGRLTREESVATRDLSVLDAGWRGVLGETDDSRGVVMQAGVAAMAVRTWANDGVGWRSPTAGSDPSTGAPPPSSVPVTGLEVALDLGQRPGKVVKLFLLGSV